MEQFIPIRRFAEQYNLKITRDECGDQIILGRAGQLYFDAGSLCAAWPEAKPINRSRLAELGGRMWQGDISMKHGRRVQDAWVRGINPMRTVWPFG